MTKNVNLKRISSVSVSVIAIVALVSVFGIHRANATITSQLGLGSSGSQVSELQRFLAADPLIYPQGIVSGYFGPLTRAAVMQYQIAYNISPVGTVGPITRASISSVQASGLGLDTSAPIISTVPPVQLTNNSATITWSTNEAALGRVVYGTVPVVIGNTFDSTGINFATPTVVSGTLAPYDSVLRSAQTVTISGLTPNTTYYYIIEALDASNNLSVTVSSTFHTAQ